MQLTVDNSFMPQLMQMVSQQRQQLSRDKQLLGDLMQSTVEERVEKQRKVLEVEKRRIATIDDAERQARVEIAENRERAKQEELREQAEKDALLEWEAFVPDPPPPPEEFEVREYLQEEKAVVLADENKVQLSPEWGDERIE